MKKMMLAAAALCAVAAFADEATPAKAAAEQPKPAEKTFTVGFDAEFPPYGYKDGNEYKGFDLDLAR